MAIIPSPDECFTDLIGRIEGFTRSLDDDKEIIVMVAGFPHFQARCIFRVGLDWLVFVGETDHGGRAEIMQHIGNVSVKMAEVPRRNQEKKSILFVPPEKK